MNIVKLLKKYKSAFRGPRALIGFVLLAASLLLLMLALLLPRSDGEPVSADTSAPDTQTTDTPTPDTSAPDTPVTDTPTPDIPPVDTVTTAPETTAAAKTPTGQLDMSGELKSDTGTNLNLRIEWKAKQDVGSGAATITADVYLDYVRLYVSARTGSIDIGGEKKAIATSAFNVSERVPHSTKIASETITTARKAGEDKEIIINADWYLGATYSGVYISTVKVSGSITLSDMPDSDTTALDTTTPNTTASSMPVPGTTASGTPAPGTTASSTPAPCTTASGTPVPGTTASGTPAPGTTASSTPVPGTTATNAPAPDTTASNTPTPDTPAAGFFDISGEIKSNTGTKLNLRIEWTARRNPDDAYTTVTALVYLDYIKLYIKPRDGAVTIGGEKTTFTTVRFSESAEEAHSTLIASKTVKVAPTGKGDSDKIEISAQWYLGATYSGVSIGEITAKGSITLPGGNLNIPSSASLGVPYVPQLPDLPNGCEVTSLAALLDYLGFGADKTTLSDYYLDKGEVGVADYRKQNVGDPRSVNSYGCYAPVIYNCAAKYLADAYGGWQYAPHDLTGCSVSELYFRVSQGEPVIVWITTDLNIEPKVIKTWVVDGETLEWKHPQHCVVLCGYDFEAGTVTISDPLAGVITRPMSLFELRWRQMGSQAVAVY